MANQGPLVQFARFSSGRIILFRAHTGDLEYVAISHVWGAIAWRWVPSAGKKLLISKTKARFIDQDLNSLVGNTPFWMDTVTVDQHNEKEVIHAVTNVPAIFRDTKMTIAIREPDGFGVCCQQSVLGVNERSQWWSCLKAHVEKEHFSHVLDESYLRRLWTLQECLLSHTITFVSLPQEGSSKKPHEPINWDPLSWQTDWERARDSLQLLGICFRRRLKAPQTTMFDFERAYVLGGTVSIDVESEHSSEDDGVLLLQRFHIGSVRKATESRDYIFATMPQLSWYSYPNNADRMTFSEIFVDLHQQLARIGGAFAYRFTRSMTDWERCTIEDAWLPSLQQPEPTTLGDFLKLLGQRIDESSIRCGEAGILANGDLTVERVCDQDVVDEQQCFAIIQKMMWISQNSWLESKRGGELAMFGGFPLDDLTLTPQFLIDCLTKDLEETDAEDKLNRKDLEERISRLRANVTKKQSEMESDDWIIPQARRVLMNIWACVSPFGPDIPQKIEWKTYKKHMLGKWSQDMMKTLLYLAAMVGCEVPLSSYSWIQETFTLVRVQLSQKVPKILYTSDQLVDIGEGDKEIFGLINTDALQEFNQSGPVALRYMGRHILSGHIYKDLFIVDVEKGRPIGLLPHLQRPRNLQDLDWDTYLD